MGSTSLPSPPEEFSLVVPIPSLIRSGKYVRNDVRQIGYYPSDCSPFLHVFDRRNSIRWVLLRSLERSSSPTEEFTLVVPIPSLIRSGKLRNSVRPPNGTLLQPCAKVR